MFPAPCFGPPPQGPWLTADNQHRFLLCCRAMYIDPLWGGGWPAEVHPRLTGCVHVVLAIHPHSLVLSLVCCVGISHPVVGLAADLHALSVAGFSCSPKLPILWFLFGSPMPTHMCFHMGRFVLDFHGSWLGCEWFPLYGCVEPPICLWPP